MYMRCSHCAVGYIHYKTKDPDALPGVDIIYRRLDEIPIKNNINHGGEPTLKEIN